MEHEEHDKLSRELDRLDEHSDEVGGKIDDARREWEAKEDDPAVPGAQPEPGGGSVAETPEQSDQLPEEGPPGQVHDDGGDAGADESAGTPGDEGTATGNPDAAGADDEEDQAGA